MTFIIKYDIVTLDFVLTCWTTESGDGNTSSSRGSSDGVVVERLVRPFWWEHYTANARNDHRSIRMSEQVGLQPVVLWIVSSCSDMNG